MVDVRQLLCPSVVSTSREIVLRRWVKLPPRLDPAGIHGCFARMHATHLRSPVLGVVLDGELYPRSACGEKRTEYNCVSVDDNVDRRDKDGDSDCES